MNYRVVALTFCILLFSTAVWAGSAPLTVDEWLGAGTLVAGPNRDAQVTMCQTQHMNCNQRCNKKYSKGSSELSDCRDNCNSQLTQCFNIANTIQN